MAAQVNLPPYPEFPVTEDPEICYKWEEWLEGFDAMLAAMKITDQKEQRKMLVYYIGNSGRKIIKRLPAADVGTGTEDNCYTLITTALDNHFKPKLNRVFGMNMLHQLRQRSGETIDNFLIRVREKVAAIEFEKLTKNEIIDLITLAHMVNHCTNKQVKHKAIRDDLNLTKFLATARAAERAEHQLKEMEGVAESVNKISKDRGRQPEKGNKPQRRRSKSKSRFRSKSPHPNRNKTCFRCGGDFPHEGDCPAKEAQCLRCTKTGHFAKVCHTKLNKDKVSSVQETSGDDDYTVVPSVFAVRSKTNSRTKWSSIKLFNTNVEVMIDSGSEINIIDESTFSELPISIDNLNPAVGKYCGYGPTERRVPIEMLGKFGVDCKCPTTKLKTFTEIYVMKGKANNLLSCVTSEKLGLIKFPSEAKVSQVKQQDIVSKYNDRFQGIGKMKDTVVKLNINKDIIPVIQKPRRVPFHLREKVDKEIQLLLELDIIEEATGPTEWQSPLVIEPKPSDQVRVCVDSRMINTAIERERHPMPTIEELIVQMNGAKYFSKVDLNKGYHQLELAEESRNITTFATHDKLYRYKRLCFGLNSAAEIFQKAVSDMLKGIPGQLNMSDDIIIFTKTEEEHQRILEEVFQRLRKYNVTANKNKCEFWKKKICFYGHVFSENGIEPSEEKVKAIVEASEPKNPEEVRSLLGMCQYLSRFISHYSSIVDPLRLLTKKDCEWMWSDDQVKAFEDLKTSLANWKTLSYFNVNLKTELIVDASPIGLGAILTQRKSDDTILVVEYASRKLTERERNYSQIEREALSIVWSCEHFDHYLVGAQFVVVTDHEPLLGIYNKPQSKPTARLHRLFLRLQPYKLLLKHVPGKKNAADYLSRHPLKSISPSVSEVDEQTEQMCVSAVSYYNTHGEASITLEEIHEETLKDETLQEVMKCVLNKGWSTLNSELKSEFQSFKSIKDELCVVKGLLLRDERIVMPEVLRERAVKLAHASHQGIVKTKQLIRETIWFPGIDKMVEKRIEECLSCKCSTHGGTTREPAQMTKIPDEPWKEVSMDFLGPFSGGEYLLAVMDDRSRYPEVEVVFSTSAKAVIPALDAIFARQGIPEIAKSDNGPPFNSEEFSDWSRYIGMEHRKITPRWPEANGEIERFMRTLNKVLRIAKMEKGSWKQELFKFLRHYRATPHSSTGMSPSEMLNSRKLRTELPSRVRKKRVKFKDEVELAERRDERLKQYMKELADDRKHARKSDITIGDNVLVKQDKTHKLSTPFDHIPYKVSQRKGSMITAERSDKQITRNSSHFKKINSECAKQSVNHNGDDMIDLEIMSEPEPSDSQPAVSNYEPSVSKSASSPQVSAKSTESARPKRSTKIPRKFDGFVMSNTES
jgi:hypothetical protein